MKLVFPRGKSEQATIRCDESVQEIRSVENAPTWSWWRQRHPHWYICCPYSNGPLGNGCGQRGCCRDESSRLSCSRATNHRLQDSDDRGLLYCTGSTLSSADPLARCYGRRALRFRFGIWGFTREDVTNLFEPSDLGIYLLQYFWNPHDYYLV
jgi:hypothetical protein